MAEARTPKPGSVEEQNELLRQMLIDDMENGGPLPMMAERGPGVDLAGAEARNEAAPPWSDAGILFAETQRLRTELERTEGDLAVAVREATTARATVQRVREALRTRETELHEAIPPSLRSAAIASGSVKVTTGEIYAALAAPVQPEETQHG